MAEQSPAGDSELSAGSTKPFLPTPSPSWQTRERSKGDGPQRRLGRFELLSLLGRGGFGQVWRAFDPHLDREVALKVPRFDDPSDNEAERFFREARAAAQLRHPHIVTLHDAGEADGQLYIASEFIDGLSLAAWLKEHKPSFRESCLLIKKLAEALHYAHSQGIFHRDIKPANVMMDRQGQPHLTDFGLARRAEQETTMTTEGIVLGTPAYMSPEQARGQSRQADARSDLYSLGVVLYEVLTGRRPFDGPPHLVMRRIIDEEPVPPRKLNPGVPRDLETICLKCLVKEPQRRYASAQHLADELERWLRHEPIQARQITPLARAWRWCRRNPVLAGTIALSALILTVVLTVAFVRISEERDVAIENQKAAEASERIRRANLYVAEMNLGFQAWEKHNLAQALELLERQRPEPEREDLRGFEWRCLWRLCHGERQRLVGHTGWVVRTVFSPDGKTLATADHLGNFKLWNAASGALRVTVSAHGECIPALAFSADSKILATAGALKDSKTEGDVKFWDARSGTELGLLTRWPALPLTLAVSPDGESIAVGGKTKDDKGQVQIWSLATRKLRQTLAGAPAPVLVQAYTPDGKALVTANSRFMWSQGADVRLWDAETGRTRTILKGDPSNLHLGSVVSLAVSPDGKLIATGGFDAFAKIWDLHTGKEKTILSGHTGVIQSVAFSADSTVLATASWDGTVRFWDTASGMERSTLACHTNALGAVTFAPDGKTFVTSSVDKTVKLWDAALLQGTVPTIKDTSGWGITLAFSPDGKFVAGGLPLRVWEAASGVKRLDLTQSYGTAAAYSPDGATIVYSDSTNGKSIRLWDTVAGKEKASLIGHKYLVRAVAFSPDGRLLASSSGEMYSEEAGEVKLWDAKAERELKSLAGHDDPAPTVAFSPDGKLLATGSAPMRGSVLGKPIAGEVKVWDVSTGELRATMLQGDSSLIRVTSVAFSPDGKLLASAGGHSLAVSEVRLWDTATWTLGASFPIGNMGEINSIAFSPDGRTLAIGCQSATVKLWHIPTLRELASLDAQCMTVNSVAFSPDGRTLATAGVTGHKMTIRIWPAGPRLPSSAADEARALNFTRVIEENRAIAAWAIKVGGKVSSPGSADLKLADVNTANLAALHLNFNSLRFAETDLIAQLAKGSIVDLHLGGWQISEAGWRQIASHTELQSMGLAGSNCGDKTITLFRPLNRMSWLDLSACKITDRSLVTLAELTNLDALYLLQTPVTLDGVRKLARALPRCRIVSEHGIFESPSPGLYFDGKANYVAIPSLRLKTEGPLTVEAIVSLEQDQSAMNLVTVPGSAFLRLRAESGAWEASFSRNDKTMSAIAPDKVRAGVKTHIAAVWDGKQVRLYVNGRPFAEPGARPLGPAEQKALQPSHTFIGGGLDPKDGKQVGFLAGTVHQLHILQARRYNRSFYPTSTLEPDAKTIALYHFHEGQGDVLKDLSGNGHHGKIVGATWVKGDGGRVPRPPIGTAAKP